MLVGLIDGELCEWIDSALNLPLSVKLCDDIPGEFKVPLVGLIKWECCENACNRPLPAKLCVDIAGEFT